MWELWLSSGNHLKNIQIFQNISFVWASAGKIHGSRKGMSGAVGTGSSERLNPPSPAMIWGMIPITSKGADWGPAAPTSLEVQEEAGVYGVSRKRRKAIGFLPHPSVPACWEKQVECLCEMIIL